MTEDELLAYASDYDRRYILKALEGTAFITRWRSAMTIRQFHSMIDPDKISSNLSGLRQRGLIISKVIYNRGKSRTIYRAGQSFTFADKTRGWRLTPKGATILRLLGEV